MRPKGIILVLAHWCPHCEPLSVDRGTSLARTLGVPLQILDIDVPAQESTADRLVHDHGDWTEDYLIPQVFLEWGDGRVEHLLTGVPGPVAGTRRAWDEVDRRFASGADPERGPAP